MKYFRMLLLHLLSQNYVYCEFVSNSFLVNGILTGKFQLIYDYLFVRLCIMNCD